jgi:hypothetical protein
VGNAGRAPSSLPSANARDDDGPLTRTVPDVDAVTGVTAIEAPIAKRGGSKAAAARLAAAERGPARSELRSDATRSITNDTLREEEIARTRMFMMVGVTFGFAALGAVLAMRGGASS